MAVLCNASTSSGGSGGVKNARASRLTTDVSTGKHTLVYGNVLVVPVAKQTSSSSNTSGGGVEAGHVEEIDNAIHDEVLEYFCQGLKPMPKDIQRIVREFVSGKFKYTAYHHHQEEEKKKKKKKEEEEAPLPGKIKGFDEKVYVGFVNREADEMSKKSTGYRTKDGKPDVKMAAYFKSLVEKISICEDPVDGIGYITSQDAYYAPIYVPDEENQGEGSQQQLKEVQGFSITDREKSLDAFKRDGWLSEHPKEEGLLCLGPRAILELGPWILNAHGSEMAAESKLTLSRAIGR
ncbi:hypothetical protein PSENEW3_00005834 [Picochlorum sp. SENEW3]|nr:hypothetical protein PSENEW3_00005834 [Picochlorum sp. SENEW3]